MPNLINMAGKRIGRLHVISYSQHGRWLCQCSCGNSKVIHGDGLRGGTQSCGCLVRETVRQIKHDHSGSKNPNWRGGISGKGICTNCGNLTYHTSASLCKPCYTSNLTGENNPYWGKFTSENRSAGWGRALRRKELGICERCQTKPAIDRHHKDDNTLNNSPENIMALCRRCHMIVDGRLAKLRRR
jgi:hypothetical protein